MKRFWLINVGIVAVMLAAFAVAEALEIPLLTNPDPYFTGRSAGTAALGVALLLVDVLLPVPSSFVMIAFGLYFGVWVGTALGLVGSLGAACVGFAIGRAGGPLMHRCLPEHERARADALLRRYGALAVLITRPLPLLAETTALVAGTSPLPWARFVTAAAIGALPAAALYAIAGATARNLNHAGLISACVFALAAVYWIIARRVERAGQ